MNLKDIVSILNLISPQKYAEEWDNTGLLLSTKKNPLIKKILLTIDINENVINEAISEKYNLIISYHPILFNPVRSLNYDAPSQKNIIRLIKNNIALYSPHTALDAITNGVNDWLIKGAGKGEIFTINPFNNQIEGQGRIINLKTSISINTLCNRIKKYLNLKYLRVASVPDKKIQTIACCAGAGAEVLKNIKADCYITGEMSHHNILSANRNNTHVILSEHTHTERGYLPVYKKLIQKDLKSNILINISKYDKDPIKLK